MKRENGERWERENGGERDEIRIDRNVQRQGDLQPCRSNKDIGR